MGAASSRAATAVALLAAAALGAALACASGPEPLQERWHADRCPPGTRARFQEKYWQVAATWPAQWCERPDGTQHGPRTEWYADGHVRIAGQLEEGRKVGVWVIYQRRASWWQRFREGRYLRIEHDHGAAPATR
jgi:hypothetical protein